MRQITFLKPQTKRLRLIRRTWKGIQSRGPSVDRQGVPWVTLPEQQDELGAQVQHSESGLKKGRTLPATERGSMGVSGMPG